MSIEMPEGVQLLELDQLKMQDLWSRMNTIPGILDDFHKNNLQWFTSVLQRPDTVWLERTDGNGILYLTDVVRGLSASGHILYWDRKLRGREQFTLDTLQWLMQVVPLQKINVFLPEYAKAAHSFVHRLGMRKEGTLRRWSLSQGKPYDMYAYGMLFEEVMAQEVHDGRIEQSESSGSGGPEEPRVRGDDSADNAGLSLWTEYPAGEPERPST